jgi:hypothetical protein
MHEILDTLGFLSSNESESQRYEVATESSKFSFQTALQLATDILVNIARSDGEKEDIRSVEQTLLTQCIENPEGLRAKYLIYFDKTTDPYTCQVAQKAIIDPKYFADRNDKTMQRLAIARVFMEIARFRWATDQIFRARQSGNYGRIDPDNPGDLDYNSTERLCSLIFAQSNDVEEGLLKVALKLYPDLEQMRILGQQERELIWKRFLQFCLKNSSFFRRVFSRSRYSPLGIQRCWSSYCRR